MIIQTGFNSPSTLDSIELIRAKSKKLVDIYIYDNDGELTDIEETMTAGGTESNGMLNLEVTDFNNNVLYSESYWPKDVSNTNSRIIHIGTGHYGIKWGDGDQETISPGTLLFNWNARVGLGTEEFYRTQIAEVVTPRVLSLFPRLRLQLDKSIKVLNPEQFCTLGYSDAQLLLYLQSGLERISQAQPYPMWMTLDAFPIQTAGEILITASMISALESQYLFAVDTDVQSFSDQGHSFVLTHFSPIKALYDSLLNSIGPRIREFKLHYVNSGSVMTEFRIGWGFWQMVNSSPPGSTFRGYYDNGIGNR
jgi:hypothetical protein